MLDGKAVTEPLVANDLGRIQRADQQRADHAPVRGHPGQLQHIVVTRRNPEFRLLHRSDCREGRAIGDARCGGWHPINHIASEIIHRFRLTVGANNEKAFPANPGQCFQQIGGNQAANGGYQQARFPGGFRHALGKALFHALLQTGVEHARPKNRLQRLLGRQHKNIGMAIKKQHCARLPGQRLIGKSAAVLERFQAI